MAKKPASVEQAIMGLEHMVKGMALKWARNHYDMIDDLVQQGNIGVIEAYRRYDESSPAAFSSYAFFWIRKMVREYTLKEWNVMNHQAAEELMPDGDTYAINDDFLDVLRAVERMSHREQFIFLHRHMGHTFDEISELLVSSNIDAAPKSIGQIRKECINLEQRVAQ